MERCNENAHLPDNGIEQERFDQNIPDLKSNDNASHGDEKQKLAFPDYSRSNDHKREDEEKYRDYTVFKLFHGSSF